MLNVYQFMRFCKDQGPGVKLLADFIEDVATFRVNMNKCITYILS